jgi:hypothetical protein
MISRLIRPSRTACLELCRDDLMMPARGEEGARVELVETVLCEARKIGAQ